MERSTTRRSLLRLGAAGLTGVLAGCSRVADVFPESPATEHDPETETGMFGGSVVDTDQRALSGATVEALGRGGELLAETTTDAEGQFTLDLPGPSWLRVTASGHHQRIRAGAPGESNHIMLSPEAVTTIRFGGDVMFGRRFYTETTDSRIPRFSISTDNRPADHRHILSYVAPLLQSADLTSVNLETALTTRELLHPTKLFTYTSHPVAAEALAEAGVDYAALGNNHAFDALEQGLVETKEALSDANLTFSGAGLSSAEAWEPAVLEAGDLTVALLSCTTLVGGGYDVDWSADRGTGDTHTVERNGSTTTFSDTSGVAEASQTRISAWVERAKRQADLVVVQIHGGEPYRRTPTERMASLTRTAAGAGADIVVNHHPHVIGGIEWIGDTLVAWSLGNFVFDQRLWVTYPTYLLSVSVTPSGVQRVTIDPLLIDGFVPKGAVGKPHQWVTRTTSGLSDESFRIAEGKLRYHGNIESAWHERTETFAADTIYQQDQGWVAGIEEGDAEFGRDLLPTGTFERSLIDDADYDAPLWRFDTSRIGTHPAAGYNGAGIRLTRVDRNAEPVVFSNSRRVPITGPLTVTGLYRTTASRDLELLVNWYPDTDGASMGGDTWRLASTNNEWQRVTRDLRPPEGATHANVVFRLQPPTSGRNTADIDNLKLIEWTKEASGGRLYDHLRTNETTVGRLHVSSNADHDSNWPQLPEQ